MRNSDAKPGVDSGALDSCTGSCEAGAPSQQPATGFTLALPAPPSVNLFERDRRGRPLGNRSPKVQKWIGKCDAVFLTIRPRPQPVHGFFIAVIMWDNRYLTVVDWDNPIKPLMDYLERLGLIDNDRLCYRGTVGFGPAPLGCVVRVQPTKGIL